MVLLAGAVRTTALSAAVRRSVLDLPTSEDGSVLNRWHHEAITLAKSLSVDHLPMRVMINPGASQPRIQPSQNDVDITIEQDSAEYRGTAGVLRDVAANYDDDDFLLVVNGAQVTLDRLSDLNATMAATSADLSLLTHTDGTPGGVMRIRCGVLRSISAIGFVDLKEQALPRIAQQHDVRVINLPELSGLPIRILSDYIEAIRWLHRRGAGEKRAVDPFAEAWQSTFGIVEPGAIVEEGVRIHDSVVLNGGRVQRGAVLVQSVVCPGGVVRRNQVVTDQLVEATTRKRGGKSG